MRSDVVLRKQLCFLQRLQKPTPCLPRHIFAAEGETAGNGSFPDVIGITPTAFSRRQRGAGSGRARWEVMQLWTKALGSSQREVRWGPRVPSWLNSHLHLMAMETSSLQSKGSGESRSREKDEQGRRSRVRTSEVSLSPLLLPSPPGREKTFVLLTRLGAFNSQLCSVLLGDVIVPRRIL